MPPVPMSCAATRGRTDGTPRFGAIAAVSRSRSTWWSIQAHCQRSYVRVEILKNESLHAQERARAGRMIFSTPDSLDSTIS
jgi:hypothetical protein